MSERIKQARVAVHRSTLPGSPLVFFLFVCLFFAIFVSIAVVSHSISPSIPPLALTTNGSVAI